MLTVLWLSRNITSKLALATTTGIYKNHVSCRLRKRALVSDHAPFCSNSARHKKSIIIYICVLLHKKKLTYFVLIWYGHIFLNIRNELWEMFKWIRFYLSMLCSWQKSNASLNDSLWSELPVCRLLLLSLLLLLLLLLTLFWLWITTSDAKELISSTNFEGFL